MPSEIAAQRRLQIQKTSSSVGTPLERLQHGKRVFLLLVGLLEVVIADSIDGTGQTSWRGTTGTSISSSSSINSSRLNSAQRQHISAVVFQLCRRLVRNEAE
jgi:hypothetical protein